MAYIASLVLPAPALGTIGALVLELAGAAATCAEKSSSMRPHRTRPTYRSEPPAKG
ncbi:hypothetical protein [Burkholderia anthina]|uniref:hypothetical protein n=1 Tax=Burkholderia anthina TaxID=179879 RepID=UPI003265CFC3